MFFLDDFHEPLVFGSLPNWLRFFFLNTSIILPSNSEVHASWINLRTISCLIHRGIWSIVEIVILPILTMLYIAWFYKKSRYQFDFCLIETLKKAKKRELYWGIKKRLKPLKPDAFYTRSYLTWMSHKHFPFPTPMERALSFSSLSSSSYWNTSHGLLGLEFWHLI